MAERLTDLPVVVLLWTMQGCEHCEITKPRWQAVAERYAPCLPSARLDVDDYQEAANVYRVSKLPHLMIMRFGRPSFRKVEGEMTTEQIEQLYQHAALGMDCALDGH